VTWSPERPYLYDATLDAGAAPAKGGGFARVAHYHLRSGVRSITVTADGHLLLNGRQLNFRGVGLHEDSPQLGFAINNDIRAKFIADTKDLGATLIRAHYPLHPQLEELADRLGVMLWSEITMYGVKTDFLNQVRDPAVAMLRQNVLTNGNHPSVIVWSIANELSAKVNDAQARYISAATRAAHQLDPTRPVGLAVAGYPSVGCQSGYAPLDVIGLNDYFGWYIGPGGQIADPTLLPDFLDEVHGCYPRKALVITEFGAEADRHGPVEERGTYEYQQAFIKYHLGVFDSKPYLNGAVYWALQEFRVRPDWIGGNPHPHPPLHEKGVITFAGDHKPTFADLQAAYKGTQQLR
jgi:beta-glucuronidase